MISRISFGASCAGASYVEFCSEIHHLGDWLQRCEQRLSPCNASKTGMCKVMVQGKIGECVVLAEPEALMIASIIVAPYLPFAGVQST